MHDSAFHFAIPPGHGIMAGLMDFGANSPELLAPAGSMTAGYAALQYGADAVYVGLPRFSARASADNVTPEQLDELTGYAHSLSPKRKVFVALNTLLQDHELEEMAETVHALRGADAVIVQDFGVLGFIRKHLPEMRLHASTQMAVHNVEGASMLQHLGVSRVTLARELTLSEIADIAAIPDLEVEIFLHGALCYSYSGLCMFSSHLTGRSANRGQCSYPCRDSFSFPHDAEKHTFSMKDLALGNRINELVATGIDSLKIEGRKKNPLYVASVTDYYRRLLDGELSPSQQQELEANIKSIFSRTWTEFFIGDGRDIIDTQVVGHRGLPVGTAEAVMKRGQEHRLLLTASRAIERYDGLQIDIPGASRPFGFSAEEIRTEGESVFVAEADTRLEVTLPKDFPFIPAGATVYLASSQAVKRCYPISPPRPGINRSRTAIAVTCSLSSSGINVVASLPTLGKSQELDFSESLEAARKPEQIETAAREAFAALGDTRLVLDTFAWKNPDNLFVPISRLNAVRRQVTEVMTEFLEEASQNELEKLRTDARAKEAAPNQPVETLWSLRINTADILDSFAEDDWTAVDELVIDIGILRKDDCFTNRIAEHISRDRIRFALPAVSRPSDRWQPVIDELLDKGWSRWEVANLWGWPALGWRNAFPGDLDVTGDWPIYALNHLAVDTARELGLSRVTLSPEDDGDNVMQLLRQSPSVITVLVYQHTPLFIGEACPHEALSGRCNRDSGCGVEVVEISARDRQRYQVITANCRSVIVNRSPYCISHKLGTLAAAGLTSARMDLSYSSLTPEAACSAWRKVRGGEHIRESHSGNFERSLI